MAAIDPSGSHPSPSLLLDLGPVLALGLLTLITRRDPRPGETELTLLFIVLPLLVRRRWPLAVLGLVMIAVVVVDTHSHSPWVPVGAAALAAFSMGELTRDRTTSAGAVLLVATLTAVGFLVQVSDPFESIVLPFVILIPMWILGDLVRGRRAEAASKAEAADRALHEREARLRASAAEARQHVARELHDVVAHAVSVMLIQAGAARQVVHTAPGRAESALLAVEATGRDAMAELRRLLAVLSDEGEASGLAPQPGIEQLAVLVERVREAGLPTELEIEGTPRFVPASLDVTVYRIVQEALTNALRYAQRAATVVHLTYEPAQLRVEILDDGPALDAASDEISGRGLVGMRERANLVGGRLEAGPRIAGGYAVRAWLPLESEPS